MPMSLPGQLASASGSGVWKKQKTRRSVAANEEPNVRGKRGLATGSSSSSSSASSSSSSSSSSDAEELAAAKVREENPSTAEMKQAIAPIEYVVPPRASADRGTEQLVGMFDNGALACGAEDDHTNAAAIAGDISDGFNQAAALAPPPGIESPPLFGAEGGAGEAASAAPTVQQQQAEMAALEAAKQPAASPRNVGWHEVRESRSLEDLRLELEVAQGKGRVTTETQTDGNPDEIPEGCGERWFAGFAFPMPAKSPRAAEAADENADAEDADSLPSSPSSGGGSDREQGVDGTFRPERQLRRRRLGSRSHSRSQTGATAGAESPVALASANRSSSVSSEGSSSSSGSSSKRQRVTSSEEEAPGPGPAAGAIASAATGSAEVSIPTNMRAVPDYSDVM